jgi:hypothetical protein
MPLGPISVASELQNGSIAAGLLGDCLQCTRSGWPLCLPARMPIRNETLRH